VPVLHLHGVDDGAVVASAATGSRRHVSGPFEEHFLAGVGHFLPEEAPQEVNQLLLRWLVHTAAPRTPAT